MATTTSAWIKGRTYNAGDTFTVATTVTGKSSASGATPNSTVSAGATYYFIKCSSGSSYPYAVGKYSASAVSCWVTEAAFPVTSYSVVIRISNENLDGTFTSSWVWINTTVTGGSTVSYSGYNTGNADYQPISWSGTIYSNTDATVKAYRCVYTMIVYVRYQNADGSYGGYSAVINASYKYGATVSWSRAADAAYQAASTSWTVTGAKDPVYVTVYRQTYAVTVKAGTGISSVSGGGTYRYGQSYTISAVLATGYDWSLWNYGSGTVANQTYTGTTYGAITFTGYGKLKTYSVTYDANSGTGAPSAQTKTYGQNLTLSSATPTRPSFEFMGWATSATATEPQYLPGGTYTANAAIKLYAVWKVMLLAYVKKDGVWTPMVSAVKSIGTWRSAIPYVYHDGEWHKTECTELTTEE